MAYSDYSQAYITWLQNQVSYVTGSEYANFQLASIDPSFEVQAFKNSTDVNQQIIFHNAADEQAATFRSLKEIAKNPSDYLNEYATFLAYELGLVQGTAQKVANTHTAQSNTSKDALNFYTTFAPDLMAALGQYDPMSIFNTQGVES